MKTIVCGKGGSGKSTISVLIAQLMNNKGYNVVLVDADESNFGTGHLLGLSLPVTITDKLGGKKGAKNKMISAFSKGNIPVFANEKWYIDDIPSDFITLADGIKLITIGKIHHFGEGCACSMGAISKTFLSNLQIKNKEIVIVDTEAGVEHFGRGVEAGADMVIMIIDPSFESMMLANKINEMGKKANIPVFYIVNKADDNIKSIISDNIDIQKVITWIPQNQQIFMEGLKGTPITANLDEISQVYEFFEQRNLLRSKKDCMAL